MRTILILSSLFVAAACGANGPDTNTSGLSACEQYRECRCDPSRLKNETADQCTAAVDLLKSQTNGEDLCLAALSVNTGFGCPGGSRVTFNESKAP